MNAVVVANLFGTSPDRVREQYRKNARQLRTLEKQARALGGKYRGYAADEWAAKASRFETLAES